MQRASYMQEGMVAEGQCRGLLSGGQRRGLLSGGQCRGLLSIPQHVTLTGHLCESGAYYFSYTN